VTHRGDERLARAIAAIDAANAADPNTLTVNGTTRPKELVHAEMVTSWVTELRPDASPELLLAARGHHLRRWSVPRSSYPEGRKDYLRWRRDLHDRHARELGEILTGCGYDAATVGRVQSIVKKEHLRTDPEVQTLEDALCLVFLQTQLAETAGKLDDDKMVSVLAKSIAKMSEQGRSAALALDFAPDERALVERALEL
jgi:hypothetical protein